MTVPPPTPLTVRQHAEAARVEIVCALRSPDARGGREPDLGAAHRAVCSILAALDAADREFPAVDYDRRLVPDPAPRPSDDTEQT